MTAYLIEVDDTKQGVCSPTVVGPFPDTESAQRFAEMMEMGTAAQSGQGGYSAVHVISDETCGLTPERYWREYVDEDDKESTFVASGRVLTSPGYEVVPFDQNIDAFSERGKTLFEAAAEMTAEEFETYCQVNVWWVGGSAEEVRPLLDHWKRNHGEDA